MFTHNAAVIVRPVQIGVAVRFGRFELKQIAVCCGGNRFRHILGIAGCGVVDNQCFSGFIGRILRHGRRFRRFFGFGKSKGIYPIHDFLFCVLNVIAGNRFSVQHFGVRLKLLDCGNGIRKAAAAVGVKGNNRLAGKIVLVKERVQDHRHIAPPVGITDKDIFVGIKVFNRIFDFRSGTIVLFFFCKVNQFIVVGGIGCFRLNAENVSTDGFLNHISHILRIAQRFTVDYNRTVINIIGH